MSIPYFEIGDKCFVIEQRYEYVPVFKCPMCNGTGMNLYLPKTPCNCIIHGLTTETYECRDGMMSTWKRVQVPVKCTINGRSETYMNSLPDEVIVQYFVKGKECEGWYPADKVFSSLEDARKTCDELNSKIAYPGTTTNEST